MIRSATSDLHFIALLPFHLMYNMETSGAVSFQQYFGKFLAKNKV